MENRKYKTIMFIGTSGGAGKTTILANTAYLMSQKYGKKIGIIDLNILSPNIPFLFSTDNRKLGMEKNKIIPIEILSNLFLVSNEFFVKEKDMPIVWRKYIIGKIVKQFINDIDWSDFDYIFFDTPPSFSDEILTAIDEMKKIDYSILISVFHNNKRFIERDINFTKIYNMNNLGIIANMTNIVCHEQSQTNIDLFNEEINKFAEDNKISIITQIPYKSEFIKSINSGIPFVEKYKDSQDIDSFIKIANTIMKGKNE